MRSEITVLELVDLTSNDLEANLAGQLSLQQRNFLKRQQYAWAARAVIFSLICIALALAIALKFKFPSFASHGELFIGFPIGLYWLWLFRLSPLRLKQTTRELREGHVAAIEGQVHCDITGNVGLIQVPHYQLRVAGRYFNLNEQTYLQFKNGEYYRIFYTPHSQTWLGGIQVTAPSQNITRTRSSSKKTGDNADIPLSEPLTSQEREILKRIASGLSNKEIASELALSINTVKMYTSKLYRKLGVRRRTEAIARARQLDIL